MGATTSMLYSGALEAAAGTVVSGVVSSFASAYKMQEELDVTLYSLQQEVIKIQCAINLARGRRITDQELLMWLASLIDAAYLGNYYHRTYKYQNSFHRLIESEGTSSSHISTYHPDHKRRRTIKSLVVGNDKLRELCDALRKLKSIDTCAFILMVNAQPERPPKTHLYMDHNRLSYRDKEKMQVMKFLFQHSTAGANNVDILPIVGPSGVGKTSLALHCFCDPKVQNHFSLKIYISPTTIAYDKNHDLPWIFEQILEQCIGIGITNYDQNTVIAMLKQNFSSEKFLLLMDSVFQVMDSMVWTTLWDCLSCGKQGSKVLFITNDFSHDEHKKMVSAGIVEPIMLDGFSEDEYLLFFKEHAFGSADSEEYPELAKIGREMAKKMNGSIWGAKILGELLRDNLNAPFWSKFLQDGFINSGFLMDKGLLSVSNIISQFLPKGLKVSSIIRIWGEWGRQLLSHELKSFRELMVLGPDHCSPVIKEGKNYGVQFLVAGELNLYEWTVVTAICNCIVREHKFLLGDSVWVYYDR